MQIAGVHAEKGRRGDIKELQPSEKAPRAVKKALCEKFLAEGFSATPLAVKVGAFSHSVKGEKLKGRYQNNNYQVTGTVEYFLRDLAKDKVKEKVTQAYNLEFCDCLDANGIPEFKIGKFTLE